MKRRGFQLHDPANGACAVLDARRALHDANLGGCERVDLRRVLAAPLLPFLAQAVAAHDDAVAVEAANHRLRDGRAGCERRHAGTLRERLAERLPARALQVGGRDRGDGAAVLREFVKRSNHGDRGPLEGTRLQDQRELRGLAVAERHVAHERRVADVPHREGVPARRQREAEAAVDIGGHAAHG